MKKVFLFFIVLILLSSASNSQDMSFPYSPAKWRTPICFVNDWQKSLVDHQGALNYDFGPGPYARPKTTISIGIKDGNLDVKNQRLHSPRVPVVITDFAAEDILMQQKSFALYDSRIHQIPKNPNEGFSVKRYSGLVGCVAWAQPNKPADPAFENVAWGTNRPIRYHLDVTPNSQKVVALGFCDSYRVKGKITRVMELHVEGAPTQTIDLLVSGDQNEPQVFLFNARDTDGNGDLSIEVKASPTTQDPNVLLNAIWTFPENMKISNSELIAGDLTSNAEIYVDCGREPQLKKFPVRRDAVVAKFNGENFTPVLRIKTHRQLEFNPENGFIYSHQKPFIAAQPQAIKFVETENGWLAEFAPNIETIEIVTFHGNIDVNTISKFPDLRAELKNSVEYWETDTNLHWNRIQLPEPRMQALFESSVRVLHQVSEIVDGYPQFQPGPTVYRGFWASDGIWDADAAMLVGDIKSAQFTVDRFIQHQSPEGRIVIMTPSLLHRETAHFIWLLHRFALLTQDKTWLENHWSAMEKAVSHYQQLRKQTLSSPSAPFYGLVPPGLTDGGIGGVNAEYSGVYWGLIGFKSAYEAAKLLNKTDQAREWQNEYNDLLAAFHKAAKRDMRVDARGNTFLPIKMMQPETIPYPQRGQAPMCQAVYPGKVFGLDEPFVKGMLSIFNQNLAQGLALDTGWLKGGVWPFYAAHRGLAELWVGRTDRAQKALMALADHASPTLLWAEEQMPKGKGTRTGGDIPQTNANAQLIRLLRHLLILEREDHLSLLHGMPDDWIYAGATLKLDRLPTTFGAISLRTEISGNGNSGSLEFKPERLANKDITVWIDLAAFKKYGFKKQDGSPLPDIWKEKLAEPFQINFSR